MVSGDPWFWTVDDIVSQVCRSQVFFNEAGFVSSNCPDPEIFEAPLRKHQVSGAAFLTGINDTTLRDDLHIRNLGQRQALLAVVRLLRSRSHHYKQTGASADTAVTEPNSHKKRRIGVTTISQPASVLERHPVTQVLHADQTSAGTHNEDIEHGGAWDHLLRWENTQDDEIAGSDMEMDSEDGSGSEEGDESDSDAMDVDETILPAIRPRGGKLSEAEIINVIDDCIAQYTKAWFPGKLASEDQPVNIQELWDKVDSDDQRRQLAERSRGNVEYFGARLNRMGDEILRSTWNYRKDVERVCRSLEATVESLEYEKWLVELYNSNGKEHQTHAMLDIIDLGSGSESSDAEEEPVDHAGLISATDQLSVKGSSALAPAIVDISGSTLVNDVKLQSPRQGSHQIPQTSQSQREATLSSPSSQAPLQPHPPKILLEKASCSRPSLSESQPAPASQFSKPSQSRKTRETQPQGPIRSQTPDQPESTASKRALLHNKESPELASISTVAKWRWVDLREQSDRKRIVMKVIHEMSNNDRETLRTRVTTVRKQNLLMEIPRCVAMLLRDDNKIQGILPRDLEKIKNFTRLFLSWWLADNYLYKDVKKWRLEELAQCLNEESKDPDIFYDWVNHVLANTFSKEALASPHAPSQAEIIMISDSDDDPPTLKLKPTPTARKKRTSLPTSNVPTTQRNRAPQRSPATQGTITITD
jgi:hypothetical protein